MIAAGCVSSRAEEGVSPVSSVWVRKRPGSQPLQRRFSSLELSPPQHLHVASLLSTPDGEQLLTVLPLPRNGSEIDLHSNLSASARGERSPAADTATEEGPGAASSVQQSNHGLGLLPCERVCLQLRDPQPDVQGCESNFRMPKQLN